MKKLLLAVGLCVVAFVLAPVASANAETFTGACVIKGKATFESPTRLSTGLPQMQTYKFKGTVVVCAKVKGGPKKTAEKLLKCLELPTGSEAQIACIKEVIAELPAGKPATELIKCVTGPPLGIPSCVIKVIEELLNEGKEGVAISGSAEVEGGGKLSCAASVGGYGEVGGQETLPAGKGKIEIPGSTVKFKFRFIGTGTEVHFQAGDEAASETTGYTAAGEASFAEDTGAVAECASEVGPASLEFDAVAVGEI
jgi:hypothetical protein